MRLIEADEIVPAFHDRQTVLAAFRAPADYESRVRGWLRASPRRFCLRPYMISASGHSALTLSVAMSASSASTITCSALLFSFSPTAIAMGRC